MFKKKGNETIMVQKKPRKKIKAWKIVALIIVLLIVVRIVVVSVFGGNKEMTAMVDTVPVTRGDVTSTLDTSGTIASEEMKVYASPVNATVGSVPVEIGQSVKKGDYLLTYNTDSLEKSYNIAELQAKAEQATSSDLLHKSSKNAGDMTTSSGDASTLQGQIDALNAELASLRAQATQVEIDGNNSSATNAEITAMNAEMESVLAQIAELQKKAGDGSISDKEKEALSELNKQKKSLEKSIAKKQDKISDAKDIANNATNIQAQVAEKSSQLADLQSRLAEAEGKNTAAEASVLSDQAKANINYGQQAAKLTLEQSADNLSAAKAGVAADFDGVVTDVQAAQGTAAVEGAPLLTLASVENMCVQIPVSKYNLENLKMDQEVEITFQDKTYKGNVSYISKMAIAGENGSAMVNVKVHIQQPDDALIIGLDAKVSVQLGTAPNTLLVPVAAVNSDSQGDFIYVVEKDVVGKKYVTTGMSSKEEIELKSGVSEGEKVITSVDSSIVEGMKVLENEAADTEAAGQVDEAGQMTVEAAPAAVAK